MTLPGFTAEKSLYQSPERYVAVRSGGSGSGEHIDRPGCSAGARDFRRNAAHAI